MPVQATAGTQTRDHGPRVLDHPLRTDRHVQQRRRQTRQDANTDRNPNPRHTGRHFGRVHTGRNRRKQHAEKEPAQPTAHPWLGAGLGEQQGNPGNERQPCPLQRRERREQQQGRRNRGRGPLAGRYPRGAGYHAYWSLRTTVG